MEFLYHGSAKPGITELETRSALHNSEKAVIYLTDCIPYALCYIWDAEHNGYSGKHVTAWIQDGITCYEEQFPHQLAVFYQGVSGYLYRIGKHCGMQPVQEREGVYASLEKVNVAGAEWIPDVYEALMQQEQLGFFKIFRYHEQSEQRQNELIDFMARAIVKSGFYRSDPLRAKFMQRHFSEAWQRAAKQK